MADTYKIVFTPAEPFFFGNEKSFLFNGANIKSQYSASYFMKSEEMPSQSSILGVLRYLFLVHKNHNFRYDKTQQDDNNKVVGEKSFDIDSDDNQEFGIIKKISPIFIQKTTANGENLRLIPTPFDHKKEVPSEHDKKIKIPTTHYTPFNDYSSPLATIDGEKICAHDFDVKSGIADSFMSVSDNKIYFKKDIYESDLRVGINRNAKNDGFFKKEYKMLKKGFSFAVYVELDVDTYAALAKENSIDLAKPQSVFMGQGKSAFSVMFIKEENTLIGDIEKALKGHRKCVYCLGDTFVSSNPYQNTLFAVSDSKDYRAFKTVNYGNIEKGPSLHRLLKAGSIFISENPDEWVKEHSNPKANIIGFNTFITIGE